MNQTSEISHYYHDKMITCINFDFVQQLLNTFISYLDSIHVSLASS